MTCLIVDDERSSRENLSELLRKYCQELIISGTADSVTTAVDQINNLKPVIVFLDIHMGDGTGFDVLKKCNNLLFEVIFVTAFDQYGIHAIKFSAVDYLLKPIDPEQLITAVGKAIAQIRLKADNKRLSNFLHNQYKPDENKRIALPFVESIEFVEVKEIIRLEANGSYTNFILADNRKLLVSKSLKEYDEMLGVYGFIRTHQAHLVNPAFIKSMVKSDGGYLKLKNNDSVPISRLRKTEVLERLKL